MAIDLNVDFQKLPLYDWPNKTVSGRVYNKCYLEFPIEVTSSSGQKIQYLIEIALLPSDESIDLHFVDFYVATGRQPSYGIWGVYLCGASSVYAGQDVVIYFNYVCYNSDGTLNSGFSNTTTSFTTVNFDVAPKYITSVGKLASFSNMYTSSPPTVNIDTQNYLFENSEVPAQQYPIKLLGEGFELTVVGSKVSTTTLQTDEASFQGFTPKLPQFGDNSTSGGATGSFDNTSDDVDIPSAPSGGAVSSGLIKLYTPSTAQLNEFSSFLWKGDFFDNIKKLFADPMEAVISLSCFPFVIPTNGSESIKIGLIDSGVQSLIVNSQFYTFDFGVLSLKEYWGQALDYSPYTKASIYLPYIGIQPIDIDDIQGANLNVVYNVDLLTGAFSAFLKVGKNVQGTSLNSVLYQWSGNISTPLPLSAQNFSSFFSSIVNVAATAGVGAVTGGVGGAIASGGTALASSARNVQNQKEHIQRGGRIDSSVGALSVPYPYLILTRPIQSLSSSYRSERGYPSNISKKIGDLKGFTTCDNPIMTGITCTEAEKNDIIEKLRNGVIL